MLFYFYWELRSVNQRWWDNKPVYDIECLHDNVMETFKPLQNYISNRFICFLLQMMMILCVVSFSSSALIHWFLMSSSLQLPTALILFYIVKFFSDTSLTLSKPVNILWQPIPIMGFQITNTTFFHANIDIFIGLLLISTLYFIMTGNIKSK